MSYIIHESIDKSTGCRIRVYNNGKKEWSLFGQLHRPNGPAIEHTDGRVEYKIHGKSVSLEEYMEYMKHPEKEDAEYLQRSSTLVSKIIQKLKDKEENIMSNNDFEDEEPTVIIPIPEELDTSFKFDGIIIQENKIELTNEQTSFVMGYAEALGLSFQTALNVVICDAMTHFMNKRT